MIVTNSWSKKHIHVAGVTNEYKTAVYALHSKQQSCSGNAGLDCLTTDDILYRQIAVTIPIVLNQIRC